MHAQKQAEQSHAELEDLAAEIPPRDGTGCPVCRNWRLWDGEERHDDGHATRCALRGVTRWATGTKGEEPP